MDDVEILARKLCRAEGHNPDADDAVSYDSVIRRSDGQGVSTARLTHPIKRWERYRAQARSVLADKIT
jgi:hypothetical protein